MFKKNIQRLSVVNKTLWADLLANDWMDAFNREIQRYAILKLKRKMIDKLKLNKINIKKPVIEIGN